MTAWNRLHVIGCSPLGTAKGIGFRNPIVEDPEHRYFVVRDINADDPEPNTFVTSDELSHMTRFAPQRAQRGHVLLVASASFTGVFDSLRLQIPAGLGWIPATDGQKLTYAPSTTLLSWVSSMLEEIVKWSSERLAEHLATRGSVSIPEIVAALSEANYLAAL